MAPKAKEKANKGSTPQQVIAIEDLFTSLNKFIQQSEYDKAVKIAEQVLSVAPGDEDALQCKIVALIRNDNIDQALQTIQSSQSLSADLSFLKAYCLYRLNKLDEALESLKTQEKNSDTMLLESQILYRLGRMESCLEIYQKLQNSGIDSLEINFVAGLVGAGRSSEVQKLLGALKVKPTSSFELAYNTACSLIEENKYKDAEQLLLSARRVGQESLMEDNWADDDVENELAPIAVQLAYVQQACPALLASICSVELVYQLLLELLASNGLSWKTLSPVSLLIFHMSLSLAIPTHTFPHILLTSLAHTLLSRPCTHAHTPQILPTISLPHTLAAPAHTRAPLPRISHQHQQCPSEPNFANPGERCPNPFVGSVQPSALRCLLYTHLCVHTACTIAATAPSTHIHIRCTQQTTATYITDL